MACRMSAQQTGYWPDLSWELVIPTQGHQSGSCISTTNRRRAPCQVFFSGCPYTWRGYTHQFSAGFEPFLASSSETTEPGISYFCLYNTPKLAFTFSVNHTKNLCLKAKHPCQAARNQSGHWDYRTRFPLLSKGQPHTSSSPVCRVGEVCERKQLSPKHLLLPQTPPPQPQHAYKLLQLCQKTRNASRKPFPCNHSWM